jgi:hypothetical protein
MLQAFDAEFKSKFDKGFPRWEPFRKIVDLLLKKDKPLIIIETGTLRTKDDWGGNGQSTLIWDWLIQRTMGICHSIDINPTACQNAQEMTKNVSVVQADSIFALRSSALVSDADLLYLDSYDWSPTSQVSSREFPSSYWRTGSMLG